MKTLLLLISLLISQTVFSVSEGEEGQTKDCEMVAQGIRNSEPSKIEDKASEETSEKDRDASTLTQ